MDLVWTKEHRTSPSSVHYLSDPDVVVVGATVEDETELRFYAGDDGAYRGRVWIEGKPTDVRYAEVADTIFVQSTEDRFHAVDPDTATVRWETLAVPRGVSTATEDAVFVYGSRVLRSHTIDEGDTRWASGLPRDEYGGDADWLRCVDGTLLFGRDDINGRSELTAGFDPDTGDERWQYEPEEGVRDVRFADDAVVAVEWGDTAASALVRIDPVTGEERWRYASDSIDPAATVVDGSAYLFDDESVVALDLEGGSVIWRSEVSGKMGAITVDIHALGPDVFAVTREGEEYRIAQLDTSTGEAAWESAIDGKLATMHRRGPSGDDIYVGTRDGTVQRIDISTGKTRWTFDVGEGVTRLDASTTPILVGDGETVYALSAEDGRVRWSRGFGSRLWAGLGEHSVASEAADGPARLYDRCDGDVLIEKGDEPLAVGADTVFTVSQGVLGAYRLGGTVDESPGGGTVAFCPNCGADLTTYGGPSFCPECGTEIPE